MRTYDGYSAHDRDISTTSILCLDPDECRPIIQDMTEPRQTGLPFLNEIVAVDARAIEASGVGWWAEREAVPLAGGSPPRVALVDPADRFIAGDLRSVLGAYEPALATRETIRAALSLWMRERGTPVGLSIESLSDDATVPAWMEHLLERAVEERASDIHVEPLEDATRIRFRIDGLLYPVPAPPAHLHSAVISHIKVLSDLNIAERRLPQDGKFSRPIRDRVFDVRVSVIPSVYGEGIVMRLLERTSGIGLDDLGFSSAIRAKLERLFQRSHGLILATGPTGSGKTTTLYAALRRLNEPSRKLLTIEDPVEYDLPGLEQIQVQPKIGMTFAHGLRSILRHDPDVVLVGEIRDPETASIAIQAALTGHLVPSTLHTNDAPSAIPRLVDMGVERYLVASAVVGILAQRLVRKICPHCRAESAVPEEVRPVYARLGIPPPPHVYRGAGCLECRGTGYRGRCAIGECLIMDEAIREVVHAGDASARLIREAGRAQGFVPIVGDGLEKAGRGETTLDEVFRVAMADFE